jgi:cytosine/adenosine deaminase-related metal-dependent hydrolase
MDPQRTVAERDILVGQDGRIAALLEPGQAPADFDGRTLDATGRVVVPGLIQAHLHLCQTLFRGLAEVLPLLRWLRERIWPLEAAHDPASIAASARLGVAELLLGGTTAILDMGTVHHTDALLGAVAEGGIRYVGGKAMMDAGEGVPPGLLEDTGASLRESDRLAERWHGAAEGRLRYAYCPRFVLTCSPELMRGVAERARAADMVIHTHASEQREEGELVRWHFGMPNIQFLASLGLSGPRMVLAHCVWPDPHEPALLASAGTNVVHCPSCNLKLSSGIAPIAEYVDQGVNVALGADGAASNNLLDGWAELRLAGLLSRLRDGSGAPSALRLFEMATLGGARALGLEDQIGSLEPGKWADLAMLDLRAPHATGPQDIYSQLVFATRVDNVRTVLVGGRIVVEERALQTLNEAEVLRDAAQQWQRLAARAGLEVPGLSDEGRVAGSAERAGALAPPTPA